MQKQTNSIINRLRKIWLAGGCFWGTEQYFKQVAGVQNTTVGYANGNTENPSYEVVCHGGTGHAETVEVAYDPAALSLGFLLRLYFESIDPLAVNRQGGDTGPQYRTGIYYADPKDLPVIRREVSALEQKLGRPVAIEVQPLENFCPAEDYHQDYLDKNPGGYCHISPAALERAAAAQEFARPGDDELRRTLSPEAYAVTQQGGTEPPFKNAYHDHFERGVYVDVTTGQPLFLSSDKFESGCGWPAFSRPIDAALLAEKRDLSHGMDRTEVKSALGGAHLGHVFDDGPAAAGGLRYCINSAALRFVPLGRMEAEGYGEWVPLAEKG